MAEHLSPCGIMTLLTDFGLSDGYVAAMKGTALSVSSSILVVDITHEIPHQDVFRAALILKQVARTFPAGTVHVVVVDPEVGTARRPIVVESGDHFFVGPDNGVLALAAIGPRRAFEITNREVMRSRLSHTFHGRDIFAPAGAHLACSQRARAEISSSHRGRRGARLARSEEGEYIDVFNRRATPPAGMNRRPNAEVISARALTIEELGEPIEDIAEIPLPLPRRGEGTITGEVIYADQYGNLMVNISEDDLAGLPAESMTLTVSGITVQGLKSTYGDVSIGELVFYVGSTGYLEVARREGSARHYLGAPRGARVVLRHG